MPPPFQTLVAATRNPAKTQRYRNLLAPYTRQVLGLDDLGLLGTAEESGETAEENARLKASYYAHETGEVVFSDDAALYVDFLPPAQQPSVHVRRINGKDAASDDVLLAYWENLLRNAPASQRSGRWHVGFCLAHPDGRSHSFTLDLPLVFYSPSSACRTPGWPLNSLSGPVGFDRPSAELTTAEREQADQSIDQAIDRFFADLYPPANLFNANP